MKQYHVYVCWLLLCCSSCFNNGPDKENGTPLSKSITGGDSSLANNPTNTDSLICYVLCDFSQSLDAASRADVVQNAKTIYEKLNKTHALFYININTARYERPFFSTIPAKIPPIENAKSKKARLQATAEKQAGFFAQLDNLSKGQQYRNTCIINALDKVANDLHVDAANKNKKIRIVVLSDMLEVCDGILGNFNLESQSAKSVLQRLKAKKAATTFSFQDYPQLTINLVASSRRKAKGEDGLKDFWKEALAKLGYTFNDPISSALPNLYP
jgi:hypothetical protein